MYDKSRGFPWSERGNLSPGMVPLIRPNIDLTDPMTYHHSPRPGEGGDRCTGKRPRGSHLRATPPVMPYDGHREAARARA